MRRVRTVVIARGRDAFNLLPSFMSVPFSALKTPTIAMIRSGGMQTRLWFQCCNSRLGVTAVQGFGVGIYFLGLFRFLDLERTHHSQILSGKDLILGGGQRVDSQQLI